MNGTHQFSLSDLNTSSLGRGGSSSWTRRRFLKTAAASGVAAVAVNPARVLGANDRVVMGVIGSGGRSRSLMSILNKKGVEWAAVCDVYEPNLEKGMELAGAQAVAYHEYERLLERKDIDAVLIGTPEHWHHRQLIDTVRAGKDAYCEKPMSWSIAQGDEMVKEVRKTDRIVQVGMQRRSTPIIRDEIKKIFDGKQLGDIHLVQAEWYWDVNMNPASDLPGKLDWERFCGPAGKQEYAAVKFRHWRYYWPFSGGNETDQGTHLMDVIQWMMGVDKPLSVVQFGDVYRNKPAQTPDAFCCTFEYPGFLCTWTLGYATNRWRDGWSICFHGTEAALFLTEDGYRIFDKRDRWSKGWPQPARENLPGGVTASEPHVADFLECLKSRKQPNAPVEIGFRAVRPLHLANAALHMNRRVALADDGVTIKPAAS